MGDSFGTVKVAAVQAASVFLDRELIGDGAGRGVMVVPDRMRRNEAFRKPDDAGTVAASLADQTAGLLGRSLAIEKDRGRLHRGDLHHSIHIAH